MPLVEDIDVHIAVAGVLRAVLHLEAVARSDGQSGQQQVDVGRAVGTAELDGLLEVHVRRRGPLQRIGVAGHAARPCAPAQRDAHEHRAVAVGLVARLAAFRDADLRRELAGDEEKVRKLVETYFYCG